MSTETTSSQSLEQLVSLLERHHQPLVELKEQIQPIAESITILRYVGFSDTSYLQPYLKAITDSQRLIDREINELRRSTNTTRLIFQRMVREIMSEGEMYKEKSYNSIRQLATLINPNLEQTSEQKKEKAAEHLLQQYKDTEGIKQISDYLAQEYLFNEQNASRIPREIIKTYFTFITKERILHSYFTTPFVHFLYISSETSRDTPFEMKTYGPNKTEELRKDLSLEPVLSHAFSLGQQMPHALHVFGKTESYQKRIPSVLRSQKEFSVSFH